MTTFISGLGSLSSYGASNLLLGDGFTPAQDIAALVTALGGDTQVLGIYDTRLGVTPSGATVATWDDARGPVGYGPQLVGAGSPLPAWDSAGKVITTDGTQNSLVSAEFAPFNLAAPISMFVIGTFPTGTIPISLASADQLNYAGVDTSAANIKFKTSSQNPAVSLATSRGSTRRLLGFSTQPINYWGAGIEPIAAGYIAQVVDRVGFLDAGASGGYFNQIFPTGGGLASRAYQLQVGVFNSAYSAMAIRAIIVL